MKWMNNFDIKKFKSESLGNQMIMLRQYLTNKYSFKFMSSYFLISENREMLLDSNTDNLENVIKKIDKDKIVIKTNKDCLTDSKNRKIKERYSIPIEINDKDILLVLEDTKYGKFTNSMLREILSDIYTIIDS